MSDRQCPSCGGFCGKSGCERAMENEAKLRVIEGAPIPQMTEDAIAELRTEIAKPEAEPVERFPMSAMSCLTNEAIRTFAKASRLLDAELPVQHFASSVAMFVLQNTTPPDTGALRAELERVKGERDAMALDSKRWQYSVSIGGNQSMNWLDVYEDWDGDGTFQQAIDAAMAAQGEAKV